MEDKATRVLIEDTESLHQALRNISQAVLNDSDCSYMDPDDSGFDTVRKSNRSPSPRRNRSMSPSSKGFKSPPLADATYAAVQSALNKKSLQVINNIEKSEPLFYLKMCCIFICVCIYTF